MITREEWRKARDNACEMLSTAGIVLTPEEVASLEVADFGFGRLAELGLQLVVYLNTQRCCAKELVLFPWQVCVEHRHPPIGNEPGKEETFRCRMGEVRLYVPGPTTKPSLARLPRDRAQYFTVWHEIVLHPGEQYTLYPDTLHWFQAGPGGTVVSEFSTRSTDEYDVFTDPDIRRKPEIV